MKRYKLLQDIITPAKTIKPGVIFTEAEWQKEITDLWSGACAAKTDWFEEVIEKEYTEQDMLAFAKYVHSKSKTLDKSLAWEVQYLLEFKESTKKI